MTASVPTFARSTPAFATGDALSAHGRPLDAEEYSPLASDEARLGYLVRFAMRAPTWSTRHDARPSMRFVPAASGLDSGIEITRGRHSAEGDAALRRERGIAAGAASFHLRLALEAFGESFMVEELPRGESDDAAVRLHLAGRSTPSAIALRTLSAALRRRAPLEPFTPAIVPATIVKALANEARRERTTFRVIVGDERDALAAVARTLPDATSQDVALTANAPLVCLISTVADGPRDWLAAGGALAALYARATERDLGISLVRGPIDDAAGRQHLAALAKTDLVPQLLFRVGPA